MCDELKCVCRGWSDRHFYGLWWTQKQSTAALFFTLLLGNILENNLPLISSAALYLPPGMLCLVQIVVITACKVIWLWVSRHTMSVFHHKHCFQATVNFVVTVIEETVTISSDWTLWGKKSKQNSMLLSVLRALCQTSELFRASNMWSTLSHQQCKECSLPIKNNWKRMLMSATNTLCQISLFKDKMYLFCSGTVHAGSALSPNLKIDSIFQPSASERLWTDLLKSIMWTSN